MPFNIPQELIQLQVQPTPYAGLSKPGGGIESSIAPLAQALQGIGGPNTAIGQLNQNPSSGGNGLEDFLNLLNGIIGSFGQTPGSQQPPTRPDGSTVTITPTTPAPAQPTPNPSPSGTPAPIDNNQLVTDVTKAIDPTIKLGGIVDRIFNTPTSTPQPAGAIPNQTGGLTNTAPDVLSGQYNPPSTPTDLGGAVPQPPQPAQPAMPTAPPVDQTGMTPGGVMPTLPQPADQTGLNVTMPSGEPVPDDIVNAFGGQEGFNAAFDAAKNTVSPDMINQLADSGELAGLGIESAASISPAMMSNLSTGFAVAGLVLSGLKAAGVASGEASQVVGGLLGVASSMISIPAFMSGLVSLGIVAPETASALGGAAAGATGSLSALSAVGAVAGGVTAVAAPFIAWGMHELGQAMLPNLTPTIRRVNEQLYNAVTGNVNSFNSMVDKVRDQGITDPYVLSTLLHQGQDALLGFYNSGIPIGLNIPGKGGVASPSGQVGGFDPATQGELMAPYRQSMMNVAALDQMLGSNTPGSNDWYGIFGGQLNPLALNEILYGPGNSSYNPLGLNAAQYSEKFTPEQLRAAAGGLDPLDFAIQQYMASSPDWQVRTWG